jgi:DNA-binding transcriptional ArsR family regulator
MTKIRIDDLFKFRDTARYFWALGDETRLKIVALVTAKDGGISVSDLQAIMQLGQPVVSRHLGVLRNAGVLTYTKQRQSVFYSLAGPTDEPRLGAVRALHKAYFGKKELIKEAEVGLKSRKSKVKK